MKSHSLLFLSQEDILSLKIPYEKVIDVVEEVMSLLDKGETQLPAKIHVNPRPGTYLNAMPAYINGNYDATGMKWVAGFPENRQKGLPVTWGLMIMNDSETGAPLAVMDARWVTAVRTAAVAAITAKYCAVKGTEEITIIGAGEQGRWNSRLLKMVLPTIKKIHIGDLYPQAIDSYLKKVQPLIPDVELCPITSDAERQKAIDNSQILLSATQRSAKPIIFMENLHKGLLGLPLESTAWDGKCYTHSDRLVCDDYGLVKAYYDEGKYTDGLPQEYYTLGQIINGKIQGRKNDDEFIISSCHGIALSDVAVGKIILDQAFEDGAGVKLPFMRENDILF